MNYGSGFWTISILFPLLCVFALWAVLRRCPRKTQRLFILILMLLNVFQHFLKPFIYPQYAGTGLSHLVTAYNMCSFLIMISPVVFLWGNRFFRNFLYVVGTAAGIGTIIFPVWYIGLDIAALGWDYARFYICHSLLFAGSLLPLLLGHHRPSYKEFWQVGLGFLMGLFVILVNNVICISAGLYLGADSRDIYSGLWQTNPCMMMGPPASLPWIANVARIFTPSVFLGNNPSGNFAPILWYAVPLYLVISIISMFLFFAMDRKNLLADLRRLSKR